MTDKDYLKTHLADCAIQLAQAKEAAKGAKALYDDAIEHLRSTIGADKPGLFIADEGGE